MTITRVDVHGWKHSGPVYSVHHYLSGFSNRRNRTPVEEHGKRGGRNVSDPQFHLAAVDGDTEYWIVNKGHVYMFTILVDGEEVSHLFDARESYLTLKFKDPLSVVEVRPVEYDDEDVVGADSGDDSGEEE